MCGKSLRSVSPFGKRSQGIRFRSSSRGFVLIICSHKKNCWVVWAAFYEKLFDFWTSCRSLINSFTQQWVANYGNLVIHDYLTCRRGYIGWPYSLNKWMFAEGSLQRQQWTDVCVIGQLWSHFRFTPSESSGGDDYRWMTCSSGLNSVYIFIGLKCKPCKCNIAHVCMYSPNKINNSHRADFPERIKSIIWALTGWL